MALPFISGYPVATATKSDHTFPEKQSVSESGFVREIALSNTLLSKLDVTITLLSESEKDTLVTWLMDNRKEEIDLPISAGNYIGRLNKRESVRERIVSGTSHLWEVSFSFYGVRQ